MDHMLMLLLLLCSSGLQAEEKHVSVEPDDVRLVGGASRCAGRLELKHLGEWRPVVDFNSDWTVKAAAAVCRHLDCGSLVSTERKNASTERSVWRIRSSCLQSGYTLRECGETWSVFHSHSLEITCSESVRLVNGNSLCQGRVEVRSDQSWSSVYEDDFDYYDAEVVCRELGCGPPSVHQGALYGEGEAPTWTKEFQCDGFESSLLDCGSSGSARNTSSPGKAVGLTCSEIDYVKLVGGASRCNGTLEMKQSGQWRPLVDWSFNWNPQATAAVCRELDCGSAVSTQWRKKFEYRNVWKIRPSCLQSGSTLRECVQRSFGESSRYSLEIACSESVRLVNGNSLCSGRVEVKSDQSWSSVCEADFDQQDAQVVCRELGCGAPSVLQGALYGEAEAPMWTKEFQCEGSESSLLDCGSSGSARNTCSPGKAVGLTCSELDDIRLVGGGSRCAGRLELKQHGEWKPVVDKTLYFFSLKTATAVCRELDCGSAVSAGRRQGSPILVWFISKSSCPLSGTALRECIEMRAEYSRYTLEVTCSESVRLVNGNSLCSGRVEVKSDQSWSSVCEADFDQQDAEVVCRELGCGPPSVLQGALYGEAEAPMWTKEFQCEGSESSLLDCRSSGSARNTCSPGKAVGLTCSEPDDIRLVGGASRCNGTLEIKQQGEWRPVTQRDKWNLKAAAALCRELDCGSVVSAKLKRLSSNRPLWTFQSPCLESGSILRDCVSTSSLSSPLSLEITCSESVRLVNGNSLCSGRVEVKSDQSWSSVCEADFDQHDAEVVCRELGCGPPSVLQGALYGEVETPVWTKEFQCEGSESSLLDCGSSGSARNTCSPGKAVGLTCSEPVRLGGGASRCAGRLELKHLGEWKLVGESVSELNLKAAAAVCRELDCGSVVSAGALYGEAEAPMGTKEFQCEGSESSLLDCGSSGSARNTCSPGKAVGLTCSEPVRLVGGASRCSGRLEVKHLGEWRPVDDWESDWNLKTAAVVCRELDCGSAVSTEAGWRERYLEKPVWKVRPSCPQSGSTVRECVETWSVSSAYSLDITCSNHQGAEDSEMEENTELD
ncbi:scavenger receptor cysteine-rich type 1 protein M160-like [Myripristis murdjan]|uniref:scavenger receptor cysteine-rich type 1 protein M160-like n=1 Tax=Myripristis murdjan TaxID=586833 RepID=UPI00117625E1|nr:scavenger receptor cysteine-rich type 1 protein M160-like [Myripristis murdjan]